MLGCTSLRTKNQLDGILSCSAAVFFSLRSWRANHSMLASNMANTRPLPLMTQVSAANLPLSIMGISKPVADNRKKVRLTKPMGRKRYPTIPTPSKIAPMIAVTTERTTSYHWPTSNSAGEKTNKKWNNVGDGAQSHRMPTGFDRIGFADRRRRIARNADRRSDHTQHAEIEDKQMSRDGQDTKLGETGRHQYGEQNVNGSRRHAHAENNAHNGGQDKKQNRAAFAQIEQGESQRETETAELQHADHDARQPGYGSDLEEPAPGAEYDFRKLTRAQCDSGREKTERHARRGGY